MTTAYGDGRHYRAVCTPPPKGDPTKWSAVLEFSEEPDPEIAVVLGDFMFNLRSALDHIACACVPAKFKSQTSFPVSQQPIFDKTPGGDWAVPDDEQRHAFNARVAGMRPDTVAFIKSVQPYHLKPDPVRGDGLTGLGALSRLQNADKHRTLTILAAGLVIAQVSIRWPPAHEVGFPVVPYAKAGTVVATWIDLGEDRPVHHSEVDVQISGTPDVQAVIGGPSGEHYDLLGLCRSMLTDVSRRIVPDMEKFVLT